MSCFRVFKNYMEEHHLEDLDFQVDTNLDHSVYFPTIYMPLTRNATIRISLIIKKDKNDKAYLYNELFELLYCKEGMKHWGMKNWILGDKLIFAITRDDMYDLRRLKTLNKYSYKPNDRNWIYRKISKIVKGKNNEGKKK